MRMFRKVFNITLIFTLIGVVLFSDNAYSSSRETLRPQTGSKSDARRFNDIMLYLVPRGIRFKILRKKLESLCRNQLPPQRFTPWTGEEFEVMKNATRYGLWAHGTRLYNKYGSRDLKEMDAFDPFFDLLYIMSEGRTPDDTWFGAMKDSLDLFISCYSFGPFYVVLNEKESRRLEGVLKTVDQGEARMHEEKDPHRRMSIDASKHLYYLVRNKKEKDLLVAGLKLATQLRLIDNQNYTRILNKIRTYEEILQEFSKDESMADKIDNDEERKSKGIAAPLLDWLKKIGSNL